MPLNEVEPVEPRAAPPWQGESEKRAYVRRTFSQIAPRYDFLNRLLSLNIDRFWRRRALSALQWTRLPDGTYLDLCAGTLDLSGGAWRGCRISRHSDRR